MKAYLEIEMPKSCHECVAGYGCCCYIATEEADGICPDHGRPDWCPLVPVPKHGRLIDADALEASCFMGSSSFYTQSDINYAPTIIPASEEGE